MALIRWLDSDDLLQKGLQPSWIRLRHYKHIWAKSVVSDIPHYRYWNPLLHPILPIYRQAQLFFNYTSPFCPFFFFFSFISLILWLAKPLSTARKLWATRKDLRILKPRRGDRKKLRHFEGRPKLIPKTGEICVVYLQRTVRTIMTIT